MLSPPANCAVWQPQQKPKEAPKAGAENPEKRILQEQVSAPNAGPANQEESSKLLAAIAAPESIEARRGSTSSPGELSGGEGEEEILEENLVVVAAVLYLCNV